MKRVATVLVVAGLLVAPPVAHAAASNAQQAPLFRQFLSNLSTASGVAAVGTAVSGVGGPAAVVFGGIAAGAKGLEIAIYEEDPLVATAAAVSSLVFKVPFGNRLFGSAAPLVDELGANITEEAIHATGRPLLDRLFASDPGSNVKRNALTCTPENPRGDPFHGQELRAAPSRGSGSRALRR